VRSVKSLESLQTQVHPPKSASDWSSRDWTARCSSLRGGILGAMRQEGGREEA